MSNRSIADIKFSQDLLFKVEHKFSEEIDLQTEYVTGSNVIDVIKKFALTHTTGREHAITSVTYIGPVIVGEE